MTTLDPRPVLVTGATGGQGGSAAIETLKKGIGVRALVRNPDSSAARALAAAGAELVKGDFADPASLKAAMKGVRAVFSMQQDAAPASQFRTLLDAAVAEGVEQYIHSTVSGVRQQEAVLGSYEGDMPRDASPLQNQASPPPGLDMGLRQPAKIGPESA
ncbi:MAG TPA: NmrA family NAD(P)-binding protein [Polyangiaceae bacterium]|nr:NmrA family NAD(P)-binding protein [Polyangiaceae bacterium]